MSLRSSPSLPRRALYGLAPLLCCGCIAKATPPHAAPTVDGLKMPAVAGIGADGLYDLVGTISFHGDKTSVSTIHVTSVALNTDYRIMGPDVMTATNAQLTINFPPDNPTGTMASYAVSVIDDSGMESAPATGMVTLQ